MVSSNKLSFYCVAHKGKVTANPTSKFSRINPRNHVKTNFVCSVCPKCDSKICRIVSASSNRRASSKRSVRRRSSSRKRSNRK